MTCTIIGIIVSCIGLPIRVPGPEAVKHLAPPPSYEKLEWPREPQVIIIGSPTAGPFGEFAQTTQELMYQSEIRSLYNRGPYIPFQPYFDFPIYRRHDFSVSQPRPYGSNNGIRRFP